MCLKCLKNKNSLNIIYRNYECLINKFNCHFFSMDKTYKPVQLIKVVSEYLKNNYKIAKLKFDIYLNYKLINAI